MAYKKRKRVGEDATKRVKEAERFTSGVIVKHDIYRLGDPEFLKGCNKRRAQKLIKDIKISVDKRGEIKDGINALLGLRDKYGYDSTHRFVGFSRDECGTYLQYKKIAGDPGIPKDLQRRRDRCLGWMNRPSPTASPHQSDDEGDGDSMDEVGFGEVGGYAVAVEGVLGLAGGNDIEDDDCDEGGC